MAQSQYFKVAEDSKNSKRKEGENKSLPTPGVVLALRLPVCPPIVQDEDVYKVMTVVPC